MDTESGQRALGAAYGVAAVVSLLPETAAIDISKAMDAAMRIVPQGLPLASTEASRIVNLIMEFSASAKR